MEKKLVWKNTISMHDYVEVDKYIYFFAMNYNGLYRYDLQKRKIVFLGSAPDETQDARDLYSGITLCNGELYFAPMCANEITVYNITKKQFRKIKLQYDSTGIYFKFTGAITCGNKVCLIPGRYKYLVVIDANTGDIEYINEWNDLIKTDKEYTGVSFRNGYFVNDNYLYLASMYRNALLKINIDNYKMKCYEIGPYGNGFVDMCYSEGDIWILQKNNPELIMWNEKTGEYKVYEDFPTGFKYDEYPFIGLVKEKSSFYMVSYQSNMTLRIDIHEGAFKEVQCKGFDDYDKFSRWQAEHYFGKKYGEYIILANIRDNSFCLVKDGEFCDAFYMIDEYCNENIRFYINGIQREKGNYNLEDYLQFIVNGK